ncbi:MAG TPA: methionyl-tRNA formyltransferase [Candidatus Angelobacter sp.]|jgi:methionyl-tRNA formyltransferase|nr:methionyl-tRNA formyltransferase [Candidatus Angelobacter sp.]
MKLVFCGTPQFAVPSLEALVAAGHDVQLVVTQPDRPQGRGMQLAAPPVKQTAVRLHLLVTQPEKIRKNQEFQHLLERIQPDAIIVVGYGRIIPPWMLHLPRFGNINVHGSLLPKYRGAAPIQWAIANGETATGVTTMHLDEGLDTGDTLLKRELAIAADDTSVTLAPRMAELGAALLIETLTQLQDRQIKGAPQDDSLATLAPILKKEDGLVNFRRSATEIYNRFRGFQPWPGAYTTFRSRNLKFIAVRPASEAAEVAAGELRVSGDRLIVGCGDGSNLELLQLQLEGKKNMSARDFISGYRPNPGERLG